MQLRGAFRRQKDKVLTITSTSETCQFGLVAGYSRRKQRTGVLFCIIFNSPKFGEFNSDFRIVYDIFMIFLKIKSTQKSQGKGLKIADVEKEIHYSTSSILVTFIHHALSTVPAE